MDMGMMEMINSHANNVEHYIMLQVHQLSQQVGICRVQNVPMVGKLFLEKHHVGDNTYLFVLVMLIVACKYIIATHPYIISFLFQMM
jgi:hypothetical protein